jgi:hypothetical protein
LIVNPQQLHHFAKKTQKRIMTGTLSVVDKTPSWWRHCEVTSSTSKDLLPFLICYVLENNQQETAKGGRFCSFIFYLQVVFEVVGDGKQWEAPQSLSEVA